MSTFGRAVVKREVGMIPSPARQQASGIWPTALPYGDARTRCSFSLCLSCVFLSSQRVNLFCRTCLSKVGHQSG